MESKADEGAKPTDLAKNNALNPWNMHFCEDFYVQNFNYDFGQPPVVVSKQ